MLPISQRRFSEVKQATDFRPVLFDTPALPIILQIRFWWHANLRCYKGEDHPRDFVLKGRKAPFPLKKFEEHREAQPCRSGLVPKICQIPGAEHPMLEEFLILPLSFHTNVSLQLLSIPEPASSVPLIGVTRSQRAKHTVSSERSSQDASSDVLVTKEQRAGLSNNVLLLKHYLDNHSTMMYTPTTR